MASKTIFYVDDDENLRKTISRLIKRLRQLDLLRDFANPKELLNAFRESANHPQLVITDYDMPEMNGGLMAVALRSNGYGGPIIMLTGNENIVQCSGVDKILRKPVESADLRTVISQYLDAR